MDYSILKGEENPIRSYVICMGQSEGSKGVMFVMYSVLKKVSSPYVNPMTYMGILADDFETACINARKRCPRFQIDVWDSETFANRKTAICSNPETLVITFGKYAGLTITQIYDKDVDYLYWLAKNGTFKSQYIAAAMGQYREICKENIIDRNKKESKNALPVEEKCSTKNLKVLSIFREEGCYNYHDTLTFKVKMIDDAGNRYYYTGTSRTFWGVERDNAVEFKCRVTGSFEAMGLVYNVVKSK